MSRYHEKCKEGCPLRKTPPGLKAVSFYITSMEVKRGQFEEITHELHHAMHSMDRDRIVACYEEYLRLCASMAGLARLLGEISVNSGDQAVVQLGMVDEQLQRHREAEAAGGLFELLGRASPGGQS